MAQPASSPIKEAMKRVMAGNKPNSGHRPPNLTTTESQYRDCGTCLHFDGKGRCRLYDYRVTPEMICDSWAPLPK